MSFDLFLIYSLKIKTIEKRVAEVKFKLYNNVLCNTVLLRKLIGPNQTYVNIVHHTVKIINI